MKNVFATACLQFLAMAALADVNGKEGLANERFHSDPKWIEAQWHIDCNAAVANSQQWLGNNRTDHREWEALPWRDLKLCGLLFNTKDTGRYKPCPDYSGAHDSLMAARSRDEYVDKDQLLRMLSLQCRDDRAQTKD